MLIALGLAAALGCGKGDGAAASDSQALEESVDGDDDGYTALQGDCDDADPDVSPADAEVCDGIDNDCDGEIDEGDAADASTWYADADGDGVGDEAATLTSCDAPSGYAAEAGDCDDTDPDYSAECPNPEVTYAATCAGEVSHWAEPAPWDPELHVVGVRSGDGDAVSVTIDRAAEITLVLSAWQGVDWTVSAGPDTTIREIVVNGYEQQSVSAPGIEIIRRDGLGEYIVEEAWAWPDADSEALVAAVEGMTGASFASFTGCYEGAAFTLE